MSGVAAIFHRDERPVDARDLRIMLDAAPWRGIDGADVHTSGHVGLAHAKTAVTPEDETERQPLVSPRTGCVISATVRLDNRADLIDKLGCPKVGDGELILRAYEAWGFDLLPRLLGDFAFVLWDPRSQRMLCARDTSGQRSLFYRADSRTFAAASEIQQLLQDPSVPLAANEATIRDYLTPINLRRNLKDPVETFYAGILAVPPAHMLLVSADGVELNQYWQFSEPPEIRYRDDREYADHLRDLFELVVQARLRSARPLGALLSGGLDSSSIVCVAHQLYRAARAKNHGFTSLSYVYHGLDCDEQELTQHVDAMYGVQTRFIDGPQVGGWLRPEPDGFVESPALGIRELRDALFGEANTLGIRALLTGDVADSIIGGSPLVLDSLLRHGQFSDLLQYWRYIRRTSQASLKQVAALYGFAPLLPMWARKRFERAYLQRQFAWQYDQLVPLWMADEIRPLLANRHLQLSLDLEQERRYSTIARESEYRALYPPELTPSVAPWPIDMVRPFADRRLHEFLLAIPPEKKFRPHPDTDAYYAGSKYLMRQAMHGVLPEIIRTRTDKTAFSDIMVAEVQREWDTYRAVFGPGSNSELVRRGFVHPGRFWARLQWLREGVLLAVDAMYLQRVISMEGWLRGLSLPRNQAVTVPAPKQAQSTTKLAAVGG